MKEECTVCSGMGSYDGDEGEIVNPCDHCNGTKIELKIDVKVPLRFCSECKYQQYSAAKDPCFTCMTNTKGEKWEQSK